MGFGHDVRWIICNHIVSEVVVVTFCRWGQARRFQAFQKPMLFGRLQQRSLKGICVEEEPRVTTSGTISVGLVIPRQKASAHGKSHVQQGQVIMHSGCL